MTGAPSNDSRRAAPTQIERCPICRNTAPKAPHKPFCSKRCSDIDLGRWLKGGYAIAGKDGEAVIAANDDNPDRDL